MHSSIKDKISFPNGGHYRGVPLVHYHYLGLQLTSPSYILYTPRLTHVDSIVLKMYRRSTFVQFFVGGWVGGCMGEGGSEINQYNTTQTVVP